MTLETAKAIMRAQDDWQWEKFTATAAKDLLVGFIRGGYPHTHAEKEMAERAVRWAKALTEELRKKFEGDEQQKVQEVNQEN